MRLYDRITKFSSKDCRCERDVTARQALRYSDYIGRNVVVFQRTPCTATSRAGHDFVGDQQHFMTSAYIADRLSVAGRRGNNTTGSADDGLKHECGHRLGLATECRDSSSAASASHQFRTD